MSAKRDRDLVQGLVKSTLSRRTFGKRALATGLALGAAGSGPRLGGIASARGTAQESVELTFMHWGTVLEKDVLTDVIERFQEANPTIKVRQQHVPDEYETKLNTLVAGDELPDLFYMPEGLALEWAEEGRIVDMTPHVAEFAAFENRLPQSFYYFAPGKTIGTMLAPEITLLFYNKELVEAAGVEPLPAVADAAYGWDQFVETAKRLTLDRSDRNATDPEFDAGSIKQYGVTIPTWWIAWYPLVRSNGGDIVDEAGTTFTLNRPEAVEVFQNLQDLIHVHHVAPTPTQSESLPAVAQALQTKRVAMTLDGQWNLLDIAEAGVPLGVGVLPTYDTPTTVIVGAVVSIGAKTEHLDEALRFHLFLHDPANTAELYSNGLWMPVDQRYYTEPELIDAWTANDVHPPEYRTGAIDYIRNNSVPSPIIIRDWNTINSRLEQGLDQLWTGDKTAQEALDALAAEVQPMLTGKFPTQ